MITFSYGLSQFIYQENLPLSCKQYNLSQPLLSIASINDNGINVLFTRKRQVLLIDELGKTIAEGYHQSNLYYIKAWINSTIENAITLKILSESMKTKEVQDI